LDIKAVLKENYNLITHFKAEFLKFLVTFMR
jgi:hypothetical protein